MYHSEGWQRLDRITYVDGVRKLGNKLIGRTAAYTSLVEEVPTVEFLPEFLPELYRVTRWNAIYVVSILIGFDELRKERGHQETSKLYVVFCRPCSMVDTPRST
jgi:hypothetical protein